MELANYTLPQLKQLSSRVQSELAKRDTRTKDQLITRMKKLAAEHGFDLNEILGTGTRVKSESRTFSAGPKTTKPKQVAKPKLPIKYWNPLRPNEGWSGHARRPSWVKNWIENGGQLEDLMVRRA